MTRVLVYLFVSQLQRNHSGPRLCPGRRIVDRDFVVDSIRADARETLDDAQVLVRSPEVTLGRIIGRVDDQRIALPVTDGITEQLPEVLPDVRAPIQRNDTGVVDRLHENRNGVASLEDLEVAVVRRLNPGRAECDAAFGQAPVFRTIKATRRGGPSFLRLGRQPGNPYIRWVRDQRCSVF